LEVYKMARAFDTDNIKVFDNEVLEQKLENNLITALDMNQFITMDYSLTEAPGMVKKIRKYTGTGNVEDLAMTEGNRGAIGSEFSETPYTVTTTQGMVPFYDEQRMADPMAVDKAIQHLSEALVNDVTVKVVEELRDGKGEIASLDFDGIVDAIAAFPNESNSDMYLLVNKLAYAELQKAAKPYISYVEAFVRSGYVGTIAGVPIYVTKAITNGDASADPVVPEKAEAFLACKSAVTCFMKKGVEIEQEREANERKTTIYGRNVKVIALTDATKVAHYKAE
jgi:hypothetical protein